MDKTKGDSSTRQCKRLKQQKFPKTSYNHPQNLDDSISEINNLTDSGARQKKRLKQLKVQNLDDSRTPMNVQKDCRHQSDSDDDFVQPVIWKRKDSRTYDTQLKTKSGVRKEFRRKMTEDVPELTPESISIITKQRKKFKIRGIKAKKVQEEAVQRRSSGKRKLDTEIENEQQEVRKKVHDKSKKVKLRLVDETTDEDEPPEAMENEKMKGKGQMPEQVIDEDEPRGKSKKKKGNICNVFKIRNSPSNLTEMISGLSEQQKVWVRKTGFGHLLDFSMGKIPHRLAYHVFNSFDSMSLTLKLPNSSIQITDRDVYDVLGLPTGQQTFKFADTSARKNLWTSQFPQKPQYNILPSTVIDIMKDMTEDNEMFKLNFLMIMSNGLIERNTTSYLIRDVLDYDINLDNCAAYNWGEYLISCLVKTKNSWGSMKSVFFSGPIVFLTIFYVDRVLKGEQQIERQFPAFKGWTTQLLKARQAEELKSDCFGSGKLIQARWEKGENAVQKDNVNGYVEEENVQNDDFVYVEQQTDSTIQCTQPRPQSEPTQEDMDKNEAGQEEQPPKPKPTEEGWFERLSVKAVMLLDALETYKIELDEAKVMHPNECSDIEWKVTSGFQKMMQSSTKEKVDCISNSESESINNSEDGMEDQYNGENVEIETENEIETDVEIQPDVEKEVGEIDPYVLDHVELIEYLYSSQGIRDMDDYMDNLWIPTFSLGINDPVIDICKDINKEHGESQPKAQADDDKMGTPAPADDDKMGTPAPLEQEIRGKRKLRPAAAYRSPYVRRVIDLNEKYKTQEYAVWRWIIQEGQDKLEHVFEAGDLFCIRKHMATLRPRTRLYYSVIDIWAALMNEKETYKAAESPKRLFLNIGLSIVPLDETKSEDEQYKIYVTEMNHFLQKHPNTKFKDYDLIFFPILAYEHFYLVSLNVKARTWEVIDNIRHAKAANNVYTAKLRRLKKHFAKYLKEKEQSWFASSIIRMKTIYLTMPWQTLQNNTDCGVFLMRHMETYKGDKKKWDTQFKEEGQPGQRE
ncbi:hypothetical protein POM88_045192 [Heracleum sosnowskyi]|uniref:Ubiquitin-like protease family profile domain-containing protein n=1 Tax=Heracleum sosnowskyi TaxID=360622 RepID=A0AAD8H6M9_9APIA|nr:hypothetical protein POM88_045192 [Heracleum sosnowskyi]